MIIPIRLFLPILSLRVYFLGVLAFSDQQILRKYQGGILHRFVISESHDLEHLLEIAQEYDLDVWKVASSHVDIYAGTLSLPPILSNFNISHESFITPFDSFRPSPARSDWNLTSLANSTYHSIYHPLYEIDQFIHEIAALYPELVNVVYLGHSGEGREMLGMSISRNDGQTKMGFVISGAQHAREWIATATALYLSHALLANASEPHSLSHLLDSFNFHIIPAPNPDGYDYTWESDRFWYKNRMILGPKAKCVGLDMNRAINGNRHRPFESPEVNNIANYVAILPNLQAFIDLRSYGQMLSSPFSYSCKRVPKDAEDVIEAAMGATRALKAPYGTEFVTGSLCNLLYQAPGNIVDWMYAKAGIKYSYVAHLRDTGTFGFTLPPGWIRPVGEETAKMVEYLSEFIVKHQK